MTCKSFCCDADNQFVNKEADTKIRFNIVKFQIKTKKLTGDFLFSRG